MRTGLTVTVLVCVGAAGVAAGALAMDGGGTDDDSATGADIATTGAETSTLVVDDLDFSGVTAAPGATVNVENADDVPHTVTAADGSFNTGTVEAGENASFVAPEAPGEHQIICELHPQMSGTLTVEGSPADADSEPPPEPESDRGDGGY